MTHNELIEWLLAGDVSIQFQTYRDLLGINKPDLQKQIESEGWGLKFLSCRRLDGYWGGGFYLPKWTSTHYTLLDLKKLCISPDSRVIKATLRLVFEKEKGPDGGICAIRSRKKSDVCVNGMVMNYASYFKVEEEKLKSIVDFLLSEWMPDGGFNCHSNKQGATHSSMHSTLSVVEGIREYRINGYHYRKAELEKAERASREFLLIHKLFRSHRTGRIIRPSFLNLYYPERWYFDILKCLDYFQSASMAFDRRMKDAIEILMERRNKEGQWRLPARHPGLTHFDMEKSGKPSRWNTLRALRVLKHFKIAD